MKPAVLLTLMRGADHLAAALLDRADVEIITMYDSTLEQFREHGIPHTRLLDFLTPDQQHWARAEAKHRHSAIVRTLSTDKTRVAFSDPPDDPNTWDRLCEQVHQTLAENLYPEILLTEAIRRSASERDLRLVVVQQDISNDMKATIQLTRRLGIPSLHTLHGYPYGAVAPINLCGGPTADYIAVFSDHCRGLFESLHVSPERIFVTGNFEWDIFTKPPLPSFRRDACTGLGLHPERPIIVFALTFPHFFSTASARYADYVHRTTDAVLDAFAELSEKHPDWQFVLRPHPSDADAPADLRQRAQDRRLDRVCIDPFTSSACCTAMADLVVCTQSNLGIEAIIAGKPVLNCVIEAFGKKVFDEGVGRLFLEEDAVLHAHTPEAIAPAIEAALLDPAAQQDFLRKRPQTIRRFNGWHDGKATDRLCDVILGLVRDGAGAVPPVNRFPDIEPALARALPEHVAHVLVAGRGASFAAEAVRLARPKAGVVEAPSLKEAQGVFGAVVLTEPLPHSSDADAPLHSARKLLAEGGAVLAAFSHGAGSDAQVALHRGAWAPPRSGFESGTSWGQYTRRGLEIVLSRCDFVCDQVDALARTAPDETVPAEQSVDTWVVRAHPRLPSVGPAGLEKAQRLARANEANERGETLFAQGKLIEAATAFAEAVRECSNQAIYLNNLGTALHALGEPEKAWRHIREALHFDPFLQSVRDNLRALAAAIGKTDEAEHLLRLFGADEPPQDP